MVCPRTWLSTGHGQTPAPEAYPFYRRRFQYTRRFFPARAAFIAPSSSPRVVTRAVNQSPQPSVFGSHRHPDHQGREDRQDLPPGELAERPESVARQGTVTSETDLVSPKDDVTATSPEQNKTLLLKAFDTLSTSATMLPRSAFGQTATPSIAPISRRAAMVCSILFAPSPARFATKIT